MQRSGEEYDSSADREAGLGWCEDGRAVAVEGVQTVWAFLDLVSILSQEKLQRHGTLLHPFHGAAREAEVLECAAPSPVVMRDPHTELQPERGFILPLYWGGTGPALAP